MIFFYQTPYDLRFTFDLNMVAIDSKY